MKTSVLIYLKKDGRMIPEHYLNQWALSELNPSFVPDIEHVRIHIQNNRLRVESGSLLAITGVDGAPVIP